MSEKHHDARTIALIEKVKSKRERIAKAKSNPAAKTNLSLDLGEAKLEGVKNLRTASLAQLVGIASLIRSRGANYDETAALLGVVDPEPFKVGNYTVAEWLEDIRNLVAKAQLAKEEAQLKQLEARLDAIMSPELRREMELQAIDDLLG